MQRPLLDAAIVGVQKSGTTALATFLAAHPDVVVPDRKELHVFDDERLDWEADELDLTHRVGRHFSDAPADLLRLDATPITTYWPGALERLVAHCPQVRTIVLLRHPTQRAWSQWRMEVGRGRETLDFGQAIRPGRDRVANAPGGVHRTFSYVERGFYADQLDRLRALVPPERVLVLRQVDLLEHHHDVLRRVHDFLGLPAHDPPPPRRVFSADTSATIPAADQAHLDALYADDLDRLARDHGVDLRGTA